MNTIADPILAALNLANDSYAAGYKEGFLAGQKDAVAHCMKLIEALPEKPPQSVPNGPGNSNA